MKSAAEAGSYNTTQSSIDDASGAHLFMSIKGDTTYGSVVWALEVPGTAPSCKVSSLAYTVLDQGTLQTDGTVSYGGHSYRIKASRHTDGSLWAEAFQV
jgi:hypothetical protein